MALPVCGKLWWRALQGMVRGSASYDCKVAKEVGVKEAALWTRVARECSRGVKGGFLHLIGVLNTVESGNLLLLNSSNLNILRQSFDYLTDTLLPGMNVGVDFTTGMSW
ncbi:receptor-like serine/threonine-protein kinase SD1-7 isoform X1 [Senna tora]|uniref:Receptor-like serine/threonine-protein kinase SD1-7 isoform X1 n=1 Tax=Senna tora TaxID=362788 RepID=A0A834TT60_9FABA|nr:receptor-like serine/threonine-protein kinase SD1-7 isoform X1 [Senna tora]